jgi:hypothetical protein
MTKNLVIIILLLATSYLGFNYYGLLKKNQTPSDIPVVSAKALFEEYFRGKKNIENQRGKCIDKNSSTAGINACASASMTRMEEIINDELDVVQERYASQNSFEIDKAALIKSLQDYRNRACEVQLAGSGTLDSNIESSCQNSITENLLNDIISSNKLWKSE